MKKNDIPDWLDNEVWSAFKKHRSKLRKPMTERAEFLVMKKLDEARVEHGLDPNTLLDEAIEKGWLTVYPKPTFSKSHKQIDAPPPEYRGSVLNPDYQEWLANQEFKELHGNTDTPASEKARHEALRSVQRANFEHKIADLAGKIENSKPRRLN